VDALSRLIRRFRTCDGGAELIELAITLPILLALVAAIADFAVLFQRYEVITNAAREGARVGVLPGYAAADVQNRVKSYLAASGLTDAAPAPVVTYGTEAISAGGPTINIVTVKVQYPHKFIFLGPVAVLLGGTPYADIMLAAASTMRVEIAAAP
jgi:Flp pilus assembly protein TadG